MKIDKGVKVTLFFSLSLSDTNTEEGLIDTNFGAKNAPTFTVGDGSFLPAFEHALFGLEAGDILETIIAAADAFGLSKKENIYKIPIEQLRDVELEQGLMINFSGAGENELTGVVTSFDATNVTVDFNHPLAGKDICFKAQILSVEPSPVINVQTLGDVSR